MFGKHHSELTRLKLVVRIGQKNHMFGKKQPNSSWVFNSTTGHQTRVDKSNLSEYLERGYKVGRKTGLRRKSIQNQSTDLACCLGF
jgi:hypothetical protein